MAFGATSSQKVSEPKALVYDQIVNLKPADFFFAVSVPVHFSTTLSFHFPASKAFPFQTPFLLNFKLPSNSSSNQPTQITPQLWSSPLQITVCLILLFQQIGCMRGVSVTGHDSWACIAGVAIIIFQIPKGQNG